MEGQRRRAVLVGRYGVVTRRVKDTLTGGVSQFEFSPGGIEGLRLLAEHGFRVLLFSTEKCAGAAGLGIEELYRRTQRMLLEAALEGGYIEKVYQCLHSDKEVCHCRTLLPGLLRQAITAQGLYPDQTYFISDSDKELKAAWLMGFRRILVRRDAFLRVGIRQGQEGAGREMASNLREAAEQIVNHGSVTFAGVLADKTPHTATEQGMPRSVRNLYMGPSR